MKFELHCSEELLNGAKELSGLFGFEIGAGVPAYIDEGDTFSVFYNGGAVHIAINQKVQAFYALKLISDEGAEAFKKEKNLSPAFRDLCFMIDLSRNAVLKVETFKELIRHLAVMGYNSLGLYMEDTYVVKNQPYFGYFRNPLTKEDIKELDAYCLLFGIELVPYIQTLAHFNTLTRNYAMYDLFDVGDILLVGEEKTYRFIEDLISTCAEYFSSRRIHLGMDEAYMVGRGKYLDLHGYRGRFEIMSEHLARVNAICEKYGLAPMMWSDMFYALSVATMYGQEVAEEFPQEVLDCVPENIELIYWTYGNLDQKFYEQMLDRHLKFKNQIGFAGGVRKWHGVTPDNRFTYAQISASAKACMAKGIKDYIATGWGDNGAECSPFAVLPALLYTARLNYGEDKLDGAFEKSFASLASMPYSQFIDIDLCNHVAETDDINELLNTANKYYLFNDILLGTMDTTIPKGVSKLYEKHTKQLEKTKAKAGKWSYLFETQYTLSRVLELKSDLGIYLREAYQKGDKKALKAAYDKLLLLPERIETFYRAFAYQWNKENRPNGFDVQDIRIGALKQRVTVAIEKIGAYLKGETDSVSELGEHMLDYLGGGEKFEIDHDQCEWRWRRMSSVNLNE